jgi:methanogenic corrinoid protein MtbC1
MITEVIYLQYVSSLLEGDKAKCASIVAYLLGQKIDLKELYIDLFQRALYQVGKQWEKNKICVATEHVATSITECLINFSYPEIHSIKKNYNARVVVTCAPKEFHQIGAKMVADLFEINGWETYYVGANAPSGELFKLIKTKKPHLLAVSLTFYLNVLRLFDLIDKVQFEFPKLKIIVGGQALAGNKREVLNKYRNVKYIATLNDLENFIVNQSRKLTVKLKNGKVQLIKNSNSILE